MDEYHPHVLGTSTEYMKRKALEELGEDEATRQKCLRDLRSKLEAETELYCPLSDIYLLQFLRLRKFKTDDAFDFIRELFRSKRRYPDIFDIYNYHLLLQVYTDRVLNIMPYRDQEGSLIVFGDAGKWNPVKIPFEFLLHSAAMTVLSLGESDEATQICGAKAIVDLKGFTLAHLRQISIRHMIFFGTCINKHVPVRVKAFHICNAPNISRFIWNIVRPLLSKKMRNRVHFHSSDLERLHASIDPKLLPVQLGGHLEYDSSYEERIDKVLHKNYAQQAKYDYKR